MSISIKRRITATILFSSLRTLLQNSPAPRCVRYVTAILSLFPTKLAVFSRTSLHRTNFLGNQRENIDNIMSIRYSDNHTEHWSKRCVWILGTVDQVVSSTTKQARRNDFDDDDDGNEDNDYDRLDCACEKITTSTG